MNGNGAPCPPIYLPFSAVDQPLQQEPSLFCTSLGYQFGWYPFAPVTEPGWNETLWFPLPIMATIWRELIQYQMPSGVQDMVIPFQVEKASPVLLLSGPMIVNTVDASPLAGLSFTVTNISTALLAIQLNALLPSANSPTGAPVEGDPSNYWFRALVSVVG